MHLHETPYSVVRKMGLEHFCQPAKPVKKEVLTPSPEREPLREPLYYTCLIKLAIVVVFLARKILLYH